MEFLDHEDINLLKGAYLTMLLGASSVHPLQIASTTQFFAKQRFIELHPF